MLPKSLNKTTNAESPVTSIISPVFLIQHRSFSVDEVAVDPEVSRTRHAPCRTPVPPLPPRRETPAIPLLVATPLQLATPSPRVSVVHAQVVGRQLSRLRPSAPAPEVGVSVLGGRGRGARARDVGGVEVGLPAVGVGAVVAGVGRVVGGGEGRQVGGVGLAAAERLLERVPTR